MRQNAETLEKAKQLGQTLRSVRVKRKWSLKEFETACGGKIKDVVLGSYERGTRSISVTNLGIIATTYEMPISALLGEIEKSNPFGNQKRVIIDLRKVRESLTTSNSETLSLLDRFTKTIISTRNDWNGEVLSLRSSDVAFLSMISTEIDVKLKTFFMSTD